MMTWAILGLAVAIIIGCWRVAMAIDAHGGYVVQALTPPEQQAHDQHAAALAEKLAHIQSARYGRKLVP